MPKDEQGEWILKLPWYRQCLACNALAWADLRVRRFTCFVRTHDTATEYRGEGDYYGETWCCRCGEHEPDHWLSDNGDFRADLLTVLREPDWDEKGYALASIWRRWAYQVRHLIRG
jgi:hypothetical protein